MLTGRYRSPSRKADFQGRLEPKRIVPATIDDVESRLASIERTLRENRPNGRHYGWEFTLYGGSETVSITTYDPGTDSFVPIAAPGSGKNTIILNFVSGFFRGRAISDVATPFIFPRTKLSFIQIKNETPAGAGSGADIKIGINNPGGDYTSPILVRNGETYLTYPQGAPTYFNLIAVNNQPTNTAVDAYVRVVGMT